MFTKIQLLADGSFDPSLKNQLNNIKNKTQIGEAAKDSQNDMIHMAQYALFALALLSAVMGINWARKHDWKKAIPAFGVAVLAGIIGGLILPNFGG